MKICITSQGKDMEALVDPRFGRCQYFTIVDTDSNETDILENVNRDGMGGVGVQSGQFIAEKQVKVVLTGNVGPNAFQTLQAAGIEVVTGVSGKVKDVIDRYSKGEFRTTQGPSVDSHFGTS
jgi:predicted Fe-Mo cluster-binding NifX family protein